MAFFFPCRYIFPVATSLLLFCSSTGIFAQKPAEREVNCIIAADLHFDFLPETDQYYHVVAMNRVPGHLVMPDGKLIRQVDAVILAGDLFDRARPEIIDLYRQRYECGKGEKKIRFPVYPGFGNHDLDTVTEGKTPNNKAHLQLVKNYIDSVLNAKLARKEILNLHPSSRSYSWNIGDVHFIHGQRYAGDTSYCESNLEWLRSDLEKYASEGNPVVYIQHYGTDPWAIKWWPQKARNELFNLLDRYNVAAFFAGHTHTAMLQTYRAYPVYQVNNAWPDKDGNGSFAVLQIKGNQVSVASCRWKDGEGNIETTGPVLHQTLPVSRKDKIHYNAFSHNDYRRENPLQDALSFRFNCVEADLWLIDGEVYVGHEKPEPDPAITFENLYLKPLIQRIITNRGKVYPTSEYPFMLMADFKANGEGIYEVLKKQMEPYRRYFCCMENGVYKEGAILFFISGNRPMHTLPSETLRFAFIDGQIRDIGKGIPASLTPVVSDNYQSYFSWDGEGKMPVEQYKKMKEILKNVHKEKKMFRWWGAPDTEAFKKLFLQIGVDLVGTDDLNLLYTLITENE